MRILADTNVIIDALTSREPWNKSAEEIFLMAANHTIEMYITASSATDIYYLIRKHLHNINLKDDNGKALFIDWNIRGYSG